MKDWTQSDIRRLLDSALDGFAFEFFDAPSYKSLGRKEKLKICRALKADAATRFAYEWMMRTA
jgi:hypothetical protein